MAGYGRKRHRATNAQLARAHAFRYNGWINYVDSNGNLIDRRRDRKGAPRGARFKNPISNTMAAILTTAAGVGFGLFFYELFTKARNA